MRPFLKGKTAISLSLFYQSLFLFPIFLTSASHIHLFASEPQWMTQFIGPSEEPCEIRVEEIVNCTNLQMRSVLTNIGLREGAGRGVDEGE